MRQPRYKITYGLPIQGPDGKINYGETQHKAQAAKHSANSATTMFKGKAQDARKRLDSEATLALGTKGVWGYAAFGSGIGQSNILIARNGSRNEVYLGGSLSTFGPNNYWHALRYDPAARDYHQVFVSDFFPAGITRIALGNVVGGPAKEILVATADGHVLVYHKARKTLLRDLATGLNDVTGMAVADLAGDGLDSIVLCTADHLRVYRGTGELEWELPGIGGIDVVTGQMDADAALEIAVTGGQVVDTATRLVQWNWPEGFGKDLEVADIDGDTMVELIVAEPWYFVWSYDVDRKLPKWSIPIDLDIGAIDVLDIDKDGVVELLVGEGQWGKILAFDTKTQALKWSIQNPEHGVTAIAVGDVDGQGKTELLWGAGASSTGADHLYIANWTKQSIKWQNVHLDGPFLGPNYGDLDGDGVKEIVVASFESDSGYKSGRLVVFDGNSLKPRALSEPVVGGLAWTGLHDLKLRDLDRDGRMEILVATDRLYDGVIEVYRLDAANKFSLLWTNAARPVGAPFHSVEAADMDGDGQMEILGGGGREHTGADGVFIYAYDFATGAEEWHSFQLGDYWDRITALAVANLDKTAGVEIIGMVEGKEIAIFDGPSQAVEAILPLPGNALRLRRNVGGGPVAIAVGETSGDLSTYGYVSGVYQELTRQHLAPETIEGFAFAGHSRLIVGSGGKLTLVSGDGTPIKTSSNYGPGFGTGIQLVKTVAKGRLRLSVGPYAVMGFSPGL